MKTTRLIAIAALSAITSLGAIAGEATAPEVEAATPFVSTLTRAQVQAEAARAVANRSSEPAGSRVQIFGASTQDRDALRAQTEQAVRAGLIVRGERSAG